jgi:hypothetical protein
LAPQDDGKVANQVGISSSQASRRRRFVPQYLRLTAPPVGNK